MVQLVTVTHQIAVVDMEDFICDAYSGISLIQTPSGQKKVF